MLNIRIYFLLSSLLATKNILKKYLTQEQKILLGVSGGVDSMLLLKMTIDFFVKQKYSLQNIVVVHCNHSQRKESREEAEFVKKFCDQQGVACETFVYQKEQKTSGSAMTKIAPSSKHQSTEATLRSRRYACFQHASNKHHAQLLLLGHHLDDRIETSFLNLLRGCSLQGFSALNYFQGSHPLLDIGVLRPLLGYTKDQIIAFANKQKIEWREDITNQNSSVSQRNFLRNEFIPRLKTIVATSKKAPDAMYTLMQAIYDSQEKHINLSSQESEIDVKPIVQSPFWNAQQAYKILFPQKISLDTIVTLLKKIKAYTDISQSLLKEFHKFFAQNTTGYKYFKGRYFFVSHGSTYIIQAPKLFWQTSLSNQKTLSKTQKTIIFDGHTFPIPEKIATGTVIRYPQPEDTIYGKTWNKFAINHKIPIFWRNFVPVLAKGKSIIYTYHKDFISDLPK